MKAGVLEKLGTAPVFKDIPDPLPENDHQIVIDVKAAAVKNLDKGRASGAHYASYKTLPAVVGTDFVGTLDGGALVYAQGVAGTIAEKAIINKNTYIKVPDGLEAVTAAALPNAIMGSLLALKFRAKIQPGQTVLINGATGVTGMMAIQIAKLQGAGKVIATGRNRTQLEKTKTLGANETVSLEQEDAEIIKSLKEVHGTTPIDIVLDYLWGHPMSLILQALQGEGMNHVSHPTRIVTVGSMAGEDLTVPSGTLRSSAIEILGSGFGSLSPAEIKEFTATLLPEMLQKAAEGKLHIETVTAPLAEIGVAWDGKIPPGKRLVITI